MTTLFSSRAGIQICGKGVSCNASWPLGSIAMDAESFKFQALFKNYTLSIRDIDYIWFDRLSVEFVHHAPNLPGLIKAWGFRLPRRMREAIQQHHLQVQTKT